MLNRNIFNILFFKLSMFGVQDIALIDTILTYHRHKFKLTRNMRVLISKAWNCGLDFYAANQFMIFF